MLKTKTRILTYGNFDLFHIGHLRLLERAYQLGDELYVGVSTDDFSLKDKNKKCIIPYKHRAEIVQNSKYVYEVFPEIHWDQKISDIQKYNIDMFVMGYYTRANSELCLLGTKGKVLPRKSRSVHQVIEEYQLATHIEEHSKKPDIVRDKIVELFGDLPRVELFARQKTEGWVCLGNEIDGKDIREALKEFY